MEARVVNNLSPAAAHDGAVRCLLAIELSKKSWVVAVNTPLSDKISLYKLKPCDWKGLLQLIEQREYLTRKSRGPCPRRQRATPRSLASPQRARGSRAGKEQPLAPPQVPLVTPPPWCGRGKSLALCRLHP